MYLLFSVYLKMLVFYSFFFVLFCFISFSCGFGLCDCKCMVWWVVLVVLIVSVVLYLFGCYIFIFFGIIVDVFCIGVGSVLFIFVLGMVQGCVVVQSDNVQQDVIIVLLIIFFIVGFGIIGVLLVMGVGQGWEVKLIFLVVIFFVCLIFGIMFYFFDCIECLFGDQGLQIVSCLMGLFVCVLVVQIIVIGLKGLLFLG